MESNYEMMPTPPISIGITTFKYRLEKYFIPLIQSIKTYYPDVEILVAVNGEHKEAFDQQFRFYMLQFLSRFPAIYPFVFPSFRSLSKLLNTLIVHSSNDTILLLNDDTSITNPQFLEVLHQRFLEKGSDTARINGTWSSSVVNRSQIDEIGYFDERLLGIGEEDGDLTWRFESHFGRRTQNLKVEGIHNHVDMSHAPKNIKVGAANKYSAFNRQFMFSEKYKIDHEHGRAFGMIADPLVKNLEDKNPYPYESFYHQRKDEL